MSSELEGVRGDHMATRGENVLGRGNSRCIVPGGMHILGMLKKHQGQCD